MRAKKHLGQNFLTSAQAISSMVSTADIKELDVVLEIGPGKGILTRKLLSTGATVFAVEKDSELIPKISETFAQEIKEGKLKLVEGDVLEEGVLESLDLEVGKYKVVANIPYYITGQILRTLLSGKIQPQSVTFIVQKEVADRIASRDGKESILSLSVKVYGVPKYVQKIPARYFNPKPKVDSAIIHIGSVSKENFRSLEEELFFFDLVKTGFLHKRKLLIKNLKNMFNKEVLEKSFTSCDISQKARAEEVPLEKWLCLFKSFKK